jgi:hypothetical protein
MDMQLEDYAKSLDFLPPERLLEAERIFQLRRTLSAHTSDLVDAFVVARGLGMTLSQTGAFVALIYQHSLKALPQQEP